MAQKLNVKAWAATGAIFQGFYLFLAPYLIKVIQATDGKNNQEKGWIK